MNLIDTHSHLYEPEFDADRREALARAFDAGVGLLLLPAIDAASDERLFALCRRHPAACSLSRLSGDITPAYHALYPP